VIIYKLENIENGKIYIGQTKHPLKKRIASHIKSKKYPIGKALSKYGIDGFNVSVIDCAETKDILNEKEKYWIETFECRTPKGYNITDGGGGLSGVIQTPETIALRVAKLIGRPAPNKGQKAPQEWRDKISAALMGRIVSEETREKIRIANTGHKPTPETLEKLRLSHLGHIPSEETRKKIGEKSKGNKHRQGQTASSETREKMSIALKGRVFSPETIERMRAAAKLRGVSDATRAARWPNRVPEQQVVNG
jgi:group I intron endonuclease